jgi:uncharacterized membrane protein YfcA
MQWLTQIFGDANPWVAMAATLIGGMVRGFAGFGSAMLMAPIFAMLFGSASMVVTITAIEIGVSLQLLPETRRHAAWREIVAPLSIAALIAMPAGLWLLAVLDTRTVVKTVSAIVVGFVVLSFAGWIYRGRRHPVATLAVGAISGVMMSSTGIGGPPVLMYLLAGKEPPEVHRANINAYFLLASVALIGLSLASGVVGVDALWRALVLFPVMMLGVAIGSRAFRFADPRLYRKVALILLLGVGLFGLFR